LTGLLASIGLVTAPTAGASGAPPVHTVLGGGAAGALDSPQGIALDTAGDLFVADTTHCRVVMVPSHPGLLYGLRVQAHRSYPVAGTTCGASGPGHLGYPTGVAVDHRGDLFIAEATSQRVVMVAPGGKGGPHAPVPYAGTGVAGYDGEGLAARSSALNQPSGIAVDPSGNLYIADTANCRVRMVPVTTGPLFGQPMSAGRLYSIAGTGVCGSAARGGPANAAQLWNPLAVALDGQGNVFVADGGDQTVLELATASGDDYGTLIGAGDIAPVVGAGSHGLYLQDGLSATGAASELNDPRGVALGSDGTLFITDGSMHVIRVVPSATTAAFGRTMQGGDLYTLAGALPVSTPSGAGNGTRWVLAHMGTPVGIVVAPSGAVFFSDQTTSQVRAIG
jgi:trimeric autotransporter adhesin